VTTAKEFDTMIDVKTLNIPKQKEQGLLGAEPLVCCFLFFGVVWELFYFVEKKKKSSPT